MRIDRVDTRHRGHAPVARVLPGCLKRGNLRAVALDERYAFTIRCGDQEFPFAACVGQRQIGEEFTGGTSHLSVDPLSRIDTETAAQELAQILHRLIVCLIDAEHLRELP